MRTVLYVAMLSATQYDSKIKSLYERLVAAGKPKKVAIVARMRKQLTVLNTIMKNGTHWDEKLAQKLDCEHSHLSVPFEILGCVAC